MSDRDDLLMDLLYGERRSYDAELSDEEALELEGLEALRDELTLDLEAPPPGLRRSLMEAARAGIEANVDEAAAPEPPVEAQDPRPELEEDGGLFGKLFGWLGAIVQSPQVAMATVMVVAVTVGLWQLPLGDSSPSGEVYMAAEESAGEVMPTQAPQSAAAPVDHTAAEQSRSQSASLGQAFDDRLELAQQAQGAAEAAESADDDAEAPTKNQPQLADSVGSRSPRVRRSGRARATAMSSSLQPRFDPLAGLGSGGERAAAPAPAPRAPSRTLSRGGVAEGAVAAMAPSDTLRSRSAPRGFGGGGAQEQQRVDSPANEAPASALEAMTGADAPSAQAAEQASPAEPAAFAAEDEESDVENSASPLELARAAVRAGQYREALRHYDAYFRRSNVRTRVLEEAAEIARRAGDRTREARYRSRARTRVNRSARRPGVTSSSPTPASAEGL